MMYRIFASRLYVFFQNATGGETLLPKHYPTAQVSKDDRYKRLWRICAALYVRFDVGSFSTACWLGFRLSCDFHYGSY